MGPVGTKYRQGKDAIAPSMGGDASTSYRASEGGDASTPYRASKDFPQDMSSSTEHTTPPERRLLQLHEIEASVGLDTIGVANDVRMTYNYPVQCKALDRHNSNMWLEVGGSLPPPPPQLKVEYRVVYHDRIVEKIVEVPVERIVEKIVERPGPERIVEMPVEKIVQGPERVVFPERFDPPLQHRPPPEHVVNTDPEHIQGPPIITQGEKKCTHHVIQQPVFMPRPGAHEERIQQVSIGRSPLHAWTRCEVKADLVRLQASPKSTLTNSPQINPQISSADKHSKYDAIYYATTTNGHARGLEISTISPPRTSSLKSSFAYSPQIKPQISSADKHAKYDAIYYANAKKGGPQDNQRGF